MISLVNKHMQVLVDVLNQATVFQKYKGHFSLVLQFHTSTDPTAPIDIEAGIFWCSDVNSRYDQLVHTLHYTYGNYITADDEVARHIAIKLMSYFVNYLTTVPHAFDSLIETIAKCSSRVKAETIEASELDVSDIEPKKPVSNKKSDDWKNEMSEPPVLEGDVVDLLNDPPF